MREKNAVKNAIDKTLKKDDGKDRIKVIELVLFKQTHTIDGAAQIVCCSERTARRWHTDFIRLVAKEYGLLE